MGLTEVDKFDDSTGNYTQTVLVNGNQVSTLSTSSGHAQGWGSAVECAAEDCGTVPAHCQYSHTDTSGLCSHLQPGLTPKLSWMWPTPTTSTQTTREQASREICLPAMEARHGRSAQSIFRNSPSEVKRTIFVQRICSLMVQIDSQYCGLSNRRCPVENCKYGI